VLRIQALFHTAIFPYGLIFYWFRDHESKHFPQHGRSSPTATKSPCWWYAKERRRYIFRYPKPHLGRHYEATDPTRLAADGLSKTTRWYYSPNVCSINRFVRSHLSKTGTDFSFTKGHWPPDSQTRYELGPCHQGCNRV